MQVMESSAQVVAVDTLTGEVRLAPAAADAGNLLLTHCKEFARSIAALQQQASHSEAALTREVSQSG